MSVKVPPTAHHYLSALRLLAAHGSMAVPDLAQQDGRVKSNIRRDAPKLAEAGLVTFADDQLSLTDTGRQWVHGQDIAEGRVPLPQGPSATPSGAISRWPLDAIRPNPLNRRVTDEGIEDLADSIIGAGDILQPLRLTPPDANGVRTLLAGERRWTAVKLIRDSHAKGGEGSYAAMADMPEALREGLPFVEDDADEAQALIITLIENSQRKDLTPLEDALQLQKLADATGWNATELARKIGRTGRERDVQVKLKIAREATPEAIADYQATGSWDRLRDSVSKPKAEPQCPVQRAEQMLDASTAEDTPLPLEPAEAQGRDNGVQISLPALIAFRELVHKMATTAGAPVTSGGVSIGAYWLCPRATELQKLGLVTFNPKPGTPPVAILTDKGLAAINAFLSLWGHNFEQMDWVEAVNILRDEDVFDGTNYSTPWLASVVVAAHPPTSGVPAPVQTDIETAAAAPLTLADIRLTPRFDGWTWDLFHGQRRVVASVGKGLDLPPEDVGAFAQRLADAFNAAQEAGAENTGQAA